MADANTVQITLTGKPERIELQGLKGLDSVEIVLIDPPQNLLEPESVTTFTDIATGKTIRVPIKEPSGVASAPSTHRVRWIGDDAPTAPGVPPVPSAGSPAPSPSLPPESLADLPAGFSGEQE